MGIVVVGAVFVDSKGYPESTYLPGGRNAGRIEQIHGGVCRNIAEDIANVELRPTFVSLVDKSGIGSDVIQKLRKHRVNIDYIRAVSGGMGSWLAIFDNKGDVVASLSQRPDLRELIPILDTYGNEIFSGAPMAVLEIDMDKEIVKRVFTLAEKHGVPVLAVVSNMTLAVERRDFLRSTDCFVCNLQEAGILFSEDYEGLTALEVMVTLQERITTADINCMVVTMGPHGAVWADKNGGCGYCPAKFTEAKDSSGAGDAFSAGVAIGRAYGKNMDDACAIGTRLAASVLCTSENVCPRFLPAELGLDVDIEADTMEL